jgi:hypothetical protein
MMKLKTQKQSIIMKDQIKDYFARKDAIIGLL